MRNGRAVLPELPCHEVSRTGRVFRVSGPGKHGEVKSYPGNREGHIKIQLKHGGVCFNLWLHRLVCRAFHGKPPVYGDKEAIVRHLDNDPSNNHANNLRWGTYEENEADKKRFTRRFF